MPRQADRYAFDLTVELYASHQWRRVTMQDLSRTGMFLTAPSTLPVGSPLVIAFDVDGERVATPARVAHCLAESDARTLSRAPGIGITFREPHDVAFEDALERLLQRARAKQAQGGHILVADAEPRLLERLSTALGGAGFTVATAASGLEVLGACMRRVPDVIVLDRETPIVDSMQMLERLACDERVNSVPVVVMTREPADLDPAFQRGAADVLLKPFPLLELIARVRRLAEMPKRTERVLLSGSLAELGLPTLLTMMEQEKKTGRLVLANGHAAWIDIVEGRIADAGWSLGRRSPAGIVMALLEWKQGTFKLTHRPAQARDVPGALPIMHILMEGARLQDEASRPVLVA